MNKTDCGRSLPRKLGMILAVLPLISAAETPDDAVSVEIGRQIYMDGMLPSGEPMVGKVSGDVEISGDFVICGKCHRRSGLGSIEGTNVVPVVAGSLLFEDLALPTSRPPAPPVLRPAYTRDTLARSIRDGIGSAGNEFSALMPRYELSDEAMDSLIDYMSSLSPGPAPGVTDSDIHFATIVTDGVPESSRKALMDVLQTFFEQKNTETRYESKRAESGPWHKDWVFKPYRKWVLHTWELSGPSSGWADQLQSHYDQQPVFAVLNGIAGGSWQPIHDFCEKQRVPCLFPSTNLPVVDESDFYSVYLSKGISLEAGILAQHLRNLEQPRTRVVQVYRSGDPGGETAARSLQDELERSVISFALPGQQDEFRRVLDSRDDSSPTAVVAWLGTDDIESVVQIPEPGGEPRSLYLSGSLIADPGALPDTVVRENTFIVYSTALPANMPRLLARSTGWFRAKRIYATDEKTVQANAFFTLKVAGGALTFIRGFFSREYFLESIEHMIDNATYTSVYPHMSLAPEQRFVSKGGLIARFEHSGSEKLVAVTDWVIPGFDR